MSFATDTWPHVSPDCTYNMMPPPFVVEMGRFRLWTLLLPKTAVFH